MTFTIRPRQQGSIRFGLIYGAITFCMLAGARLLPIHDMLPKCLFRAVTGIPCPTCGGTRAVEFLSEGHLLAALAMNPLLVLVMLIFLVWFTTDCIQLLTRIRVLACNPTPFESTALRVFALIVFIGNWAFLILRLD